MSEEPVRPLVRIDVVTCDPTTPVAAAAARMADGKCGSIIVINPADGEPQGIWTEKDALRLDMDRAGVFDEVIADHMTTPVISIAGKATLQDAAVTFREHGIRHLVVVDDDGRMVGVLSQTDLVLRLGIESYLSFRDVGSVGFHAPFSLTADTRVGEAAARLTLAGADAALVTDAGTPTGIITERDMVRLVARRAHDACLGDVATRPLVSISVDAPLLEARNLLAARRFRHLIVIGPEGGVQGILTMADILSAMEHGYVRHLERVLGEKRRALAVSERRLDLILRSAGESVVGLDETGAVTFANAAAARLLGRTEDAILGRTWHELACRSHGSDPCTTEQCAVTRACRIGTTAVIDGYAFARADGTVFPTDGTVSPLADGNRQIGAVLVFRDVTERYRSEATLRQSNQELEAFAYVASHDLQEPLRMISSYLRLLQRQYSGHLDADANEYIGFAVDGANRMQRLIKDLLAYSRIGTHGGSFAPTCMDRVLHDALADLRTAIEESGARVTQDPLPTLHADMSQMASLFRNLIGNAIKYRRRDARLSIHIGVERRSGEWLFSIRDNGIGIDAQYFERIFVIFQRLHGPGEFEGTGIGLAICKRIVERHDGRMWVNSEPGRGSTFFFQLPDSPHRLTRTGLP